DDSGAEQTHVTGAEQRGPRDLPRIRRRKGQGRSVCPQGGRLASRGDGSPGERAPRVDAGPRGGGARRRLNARLMDVGLVGLGRMGGNMATRLVRGGHRVVGFDEAGAARQAAQTSGIETAPSLPELVKALPSPRVLWIMVPAGAPPQPPL